MSTSEREDLGAILGHFGPYGGRFVPEALIGALEELEEAHHTSQLDPPFAAIAAAKSATPKRSIGFQ